MKFSLVLVSAVFRLVRATSWTVEQTVDTSSGPVRGLGAPNATSVSQYLGIPYALPPVGDLRFAVPQAFNGSTLINATNYGNSCPANSVITSSEDAELKLVNVTDVGIQVINSLLGQQQDVFSEDCLNLNVWTKPQVGEAKKAVMVWIYGGGFASGSTRSPGYNGQHIADQEDVVVVSMNYRINIFGFPGAPNARNNLGLLDQRLAIEWVRDNIAAFGGDPNRITLFGQSAGAGSVDFYTFAWIEDPIAVGFIEQSGIARVQVPANTSAMSWYDVATKLQCGDAHSNQTFVLSCMRSKPYTSILQAINSTQFGPTVDDIIVFADYNTLGANGSFIRRPLLIGDNDNEAGLAIPVLAIADLALLDIILGGVNLDSFTCPTSQRSAYSTHHGVPTWRYRYFGEFPDLTLTYHPNSGAWHGSEVPIIFGTDLEIQDLVERTPDQLAVENYLRRAWANFAKDPENGLSNYGWPNYDPSTASLKRLAYKNNATDPNPALPIQYDLLCPIVDIL